MKKHPIQKLLPLFLAVLALVVTGCPHNDYTVELKPQGKSIKRTLVFYRIDKGDKNSVTNYTGFDASELAIITGCYPTNNLIREGERYTIHGSFGVQLPNDVGGVGSYTNLNTTLGDAGFYLERFRGNDDIAAMIERRFKAADQLADILVGWSRVQLGHEPGYPSLHQFLDRDFRNDLKNAGSYLWEGQLASSYQTNTTEEFIVRFGQYLYERGYFTLSDLPGLNETFFASDSGTNSSQALKWLQRLVARKMEVPDSAMIPQSLNFLGDPDAIEKSFTNYIAHTDLYRARLKEWKKEKQRNPDAKRPDETDMVTVCVQQLLAPDLKLFGDPADHLTVKLDLPSPPLHANGKWDAEARQVVWSSDIVVRTNLCHLPYICYADWAEPAEAFQMTHFGTVWLKGDVLTQYCFLRSAQTSWHGAEWDDFLNNLRPGDDLAAKVGEFRFSDETNQPEISTTFVRDLLKGITLK